MSMLLNRKYGSRLECLYYILKSRYKKFGKDKFFTLSDLKYDEDDDFNVHNYCQLLIECAGMKCCKYLDNPLNESKCYATQSKNNDSTKSKAVSDIGGSLEALGFISRIDNKFIISDLGETWISSEFDSKEWEELALRGVLSYGVMIGFLNKIRNKKDEFSYPGIYLGYPKTHEVIEYIDDGISTNVEVSTYSQKDSNTRTVTRIIGWCVATGLLIPKTKDYDSNESLAHLKYRSFLNKKRLDVRKYIKTDLCKNLFNNKFYVENPLSYDRLHKDVNSLRENGGSDLRRATMKVNEKILNRRFIFINTLNYYSKHNKFLNFSKLIKIMESSRIEFFLPEDDAYEIMQSEAEVAEIAGIPFDVKGDLLIPLTVINDNVLKQNTSHRVLDLASKIIKELEK